MNDRKCMHRASLIAIIAVLVAAGIAIRLVPALGSHPTLLQRSLEPYYFDKFQRLIDTGHLQQKDIWEWAPQDHRENAPPGLAYISAALYKLAPGQTPIEFANIFPIIAFALWCAVALAIFARKCLGLEKAALFIAILAFTPAAIRLTSFAHYTQETVGVFFLFLAAYALFGVARSRRTALLTMIALIALILTWQQFPVLLFASVAAAAFALVKKNYRTASWFAGVWAAALILSEFIARILIKVDYSAFGMPKEFLMGLWLQYRRDPDLIVAMVRGDWIPVGPEKFWQLYGPLTIFLLIFGLVIAVKRYNDVTYAAALVLGTIGIVAVSLFEKEKNLAFGLFLLPIALGIEAIVADEWEFDFRKLFDTLRRKRLGLAVFVSAIAAIGIWAFFNFNPYGIALRTKNNPPKPELTVSSQKNDDGTIDVTLKMTNRGGTTFFSDELWYGLDSGMHIAVGNAEILSARARSPASPFVWRPYAIYPYARWGDYYFMEFKFRQLRKNEFGEVRMRLKPLTSGASPEVFYRGWMPETSCIIRYQNVLGETPEEEALVTGEGEPCIIRAPAMNDTSQPLCPNKVMAARAGLQNFPCYTISLQ